MTIDNFPGNVLLEIFDLYRQTFGDQLGSERIWNNKNGWFKLAHVCRNWRAVVLASPSRLQLRLYFAGNTPTRAVVLEHFSHLPIIVDYSNVIWKASALKRLISALRYPDRVCKIAISSFRGLHTVRITEALDLPFPELEYLELRHVTDVEHVLRSESFITSLQSLQHLQLNGVLDFTSLSPLLSVTKSLVDLTLHIYTVFSTEGASLLTHMPHLRNLLVTTQFYFSEEMPSTTSSLLPELTCLHFSGESTQVEWFVAELDTPSLREFHISANDPVFGNISHTFDVPYLSKFIHVTGIVFLAARLTISGPRLTTSLFVHPHSIDDLPSKIVTINAQFAAHPGSGLSAMFSTLEDIFLSFAYEFMEPLGDLVPWRKFFEEFRNVRVLRLHHGLETKFVEMLQQLTDNPPPLQEEVDPDATIPSGTPINGNGNQSTLDIFPLLEEIVVYARTSDKSIDEKECASVQQTVLELFGPFVTARHEVGHLVKVFWNTDGEVRRYPTIDPGYFSW
jgi:hypothetical protein